MSRVRQRGGPFLTSAGIIGLLLLALLLLPLVLLLLRAGPTGIISAAGDDSAITSILISIEAAACATLFSFIIALPLGYFLARRNFIGKGLVEALVDLPIVVPHVVAGIALLLVFGRYGIIGAPLGELGIRLTDAMGGIILAMTFVSAPFLINHAREGFESVDPRLEYVAMGLGATPLQAFRTITMPLARRNLLVGATMTWARAISEFGAVVVIAYHPMVAPTHIYSEYLQHGLSVSSPVAALLLVVVLSIFITLRLISGRWKRYAEN